MNESDAMNEDALYEIRRELTSALHKGDVDANVGVALLRLVDSVNYLQMRVQQHESRIKGLHLRLDLRPIA